MKKYILSLVIGLSLVACNNKDGFWTNEMNDVDARLYYLEQLCQQMNTNITSLQVIVNSLETGDYITSVTPVTQGGEVIGYTIVFAKSGSITIYNGTDGKDGQDGQNGQDGVTPIIGAAQDTTDGFYYWTINGEWLLDANGNKIRVTGNDGQNGQPGTNGQNGITPQLKIENGMWYVSYDGGTTWILAGQATGANGQDGQDGQNGDSMFQSVTQDSDYVYFTLADGTVITIPKGTSEGFDQTVIDNLVNSFEIDTTIICLVAIGQKDTITWQTLPFATSHVEWTSSNTAVAVVDSGIVTATGYGHATLTATAATITRTCEVVILNMNGNKTFSVSANTKVLFAPGNLQYNAATGTWRFAEHQYDVIGANNSLRSATYNGWIDLFSLGCNGVNWQPYEAGSFYNANGSYSSNYNMVASEISKTNYDFGWPNQISNGGNTIHTWRMFTYDEISYMLYERQNAEQLRLNVSKYNGVFGSLHFPDNSDMASIRTLLNEIQYKISGKILNILENYGVVFFPYTGYYSFPGTYMSTSCYYWTSTPLRYDSNHNSYIYLSYFDGNYLLYTSLPGTEAKKAFAVRLVKDVPNQ